METLLKVKQLLPDSQAAALAVLLKERSLGSVSLSSASPSVLSHPPTPPHLHPLTNATRRDPNPNIIINNISGGATPSGGGGGSYSEKKLFHNGLVVIPQPPPLIVAGAAGGGGSSGAGMGQQVDPGTTGVMRNKFLDFTRKLGRQKDDPKPLQLKVQTGAAGAGTGATVLGGFSANAVGGGTHNVANPAQQSSSQFFSDDDD